MNNTQPLPKEDPRIWRVAHEDGEVVIHAKRIYLFKKRFAVELVKAHPSQPDTYTCIPCEKRHDTSCPIWVSLSDLVEIKGYPLRPDKLSSGG